MTRTRKEKLHESTRREIKEIAWNQIAVTGVSTLSLRSIAREMGMTAPALYRYFPSRDDLVTALIIDAFDSFTQFLETARDALPAYDYEGRLQAVCQAYRQWAISFPQRYSLIFGTPVPGYEMDDSSGPAAQRGFLVLLGVVGEANRAGKFQLPAEYIALPQELLARYEILQQLGMPYSARDIHIALSVWCRMHGMVSLELFGYLPSFLAESRDDFIRVEITQLKHTIFE
jgi:AcrR family transcriptional regulator